MDNKAKRIIWFMEAPEVQTDEDLFLRSIGYEVFVVRAGGCVETEETTTVPNEVLRLLKSTFLNSNAMTPELARVLNAYFSFMIISIDPFIINEALQWFKGDIVIRNIEGSSVSLDYLERLQTKGEPGLRRRLTNVLNRFWIVQASANLEGVKPVFLKNKTMVVASGVANEEMGMQFFSKKARLEQWKTCFAKIEDVRKTRCNQLNSSVAVLLRSHSWESPMVEVAMQFALQNASNGIKVAFAYESTLGIPERLLERLKAVGVLLRKIVWSTISAEKVRVVQELNGYGKELCQDIYCIANDSRHAMQEYEGWVIFDEHLDHPIAPVKKHAYYWPWSLQRRYEENPETYHSCLVNADAIIVGGAVFKKNVCASGKLDPGKVLVWPNLSNGRNQPRKGRSAYLFVEKLDEIEHLENILKENKIESTTIIVKGCLTESKWIQKQNDSLKTSEIILEDEFWRFKAKFSKADLVVLSSGCEISDQMQRFLLEKKPVLIAKFHQQIRDLELQAGIQWINISDNAGMGKAIEEALVGPKAEKDELKQADKQAFFEIVRSMYEA